MANQNILFIAPRFHTNQFYLTKGLLEKKVRVNFLSIYIGGSENHKYLKPTLSKPSLLIRWLLKDKDPKYADGRTVLMKYHITSFRHCYKIYEDLNPNIVIIRNLRNFISIQHFIICILLRKKVYLYTLFGQRNRISLRRTLFYKSLQIFGIKHFTPVLGDVTAPEIPNTYYIPFVMETLVDEELVLAKKQYPGVHIMTIGKMQERKNLRELVDALKRINFFDDKNNTLTIVSECIGEKQEAYLDSINKRIHSNERSQVLFKLNVSHDKVFKLLKKADLFVLPSHDEPAGTSIHEAMACGLAVASSNSNGTQCYIENGVNGYVFNYSKDFKDLDVVLSKMMDKDVLIAFGLNSLERIEKYHGIDNFYDKIVKPYHK